MGLSKDERERAREFAARSSGMSDWQLGKAAARAKAEGDTGAAMGFAANIVKNSQKRKSDYERYTSGGGGCFITTAVCGSFNKPDDCYELTMFRDFRDNWLALQADGKVLIQRYYQIAPSIVKKINELPDANTIYRSIWKEYLQPCLRHLEGKNYLACKQKYVQMVEELSRRF